MLFVVGPVEVEAPVWLGSWWNIGHQSVSAAPTVAVRVDATMTVASKKTIVDQIVFFILSTFPSLHYSRKNAKALFSRSLLKKPK